MHRNLTLIDQSSTDVPPCFCPSRNPLFCSSFPSSVAIRDLSNATCFSCSSSCNRCCSTFSWAIRYSRNVSVDRPVGSAQTANGSRSSATHSDTVRPTPRLGTVAPLLALHLKQSSMGCDDGGRKEGTSWLLSSSSIMFWLRMIAHRPL